MYILLVGIIVVIIVVIILYFYYNNTIENYVDIKKKVYDNLQDDQVIISFQFNCVWSIYLNDKLIKNGVNTQDNIYTQLINNVSDNGKIRIIVNATGAKGGFIGSIITNNKTIVTNKQNFKIKGQQIIPGNSDFETYSGGKYMGCYQDSLKHDTLSHKIGDNISIEKCHQHAIEKEMPFYGLQNGE